MQFILDNAVLPLISSTFTVVGGVTPIVLLIFLFSRKEKKRLLSHAKEIENALPIQEKLVKKMAELIEKTISPQNIGNNIDQFGKLIEAQNKIEEDKKFIKYAKSYNFISAVGHILRMSNYIPKSISEHKEIAKNLPSSSSSDT